jgi:hypothetical protein
MIYLATIFGDTQAYSSKRLAEAHVARLLNKHQLPEDPLFYAALQREAFTMCVASWNKECEEKKADPCCIAVIRAQELDQPFK